MRTIELDIHPSMMTNLEETARLEGKTPQVLIIGIINDYLNARKSVDQKLKKLRGSLAEVSSLDLSGDERAQQILEK